MPQNRGSPLVLLRFAHQCLKIGYDDNQQVINANNADVFGVRIRQCILGEPLIAQKHSVAVIGDKAVNSGFFEQCPAVIA